MNYQELCNEITNNPEYIPGLAWDKADKWIMDTLLTPGISNETTVRESISTADIVVALYSDVGGIKNLSIDEKTTLTLLSPVGNVPPADLQDVFLNMFPTGTVREPIRDALQALALRPATRMEKLFPGETFSAKGIMIAINKARGLHNG